MTVKITPQPNDLSHLPIERQDRQTLSELVGDVAVLCPSEPWRESKIELAQIFLHRP